MVDLQKVEKKRFELQSIAHSSCVQITLNYIFTNLFKLHHEHQFTSHWYSTCITNYCSFGTKKLLYFSDHHFKIQHLNSLSSSRKHKKCAMLWYPAATMDKYMDIVSSNSAWTSSYCGDYNYLQRAITKAGTEFTCCSFICIFNT